MSYTFPIQVHRNILLRTYEDKKCYIFIKLKCVIWTTNMKNHIYACDVSVDIRKWAKKKKKEVDKMFIMSVRSTRIEMNSWKRDSSRAHFAHLITAYVKQIEIWLCASVCVLCIYGMKSQAQ